MNKLSITNVQWLSIRSIALKSLPNALMFHSISSVNPTHSTFFAVAVSRPINRHWTCYYLHSSE